MPTSCATATPLGRAAKSGEIRKVETLLNQGADVNEVMTPDLSPLHEAVFNNAPLEIVGLLIDRGEDVKPRVKRIARKHYNNEQTPQLIESGKN
ncbi:MAG: ankyrin repeat domain-containing protein [Desulfobacterales bacterium]